MTPHDIAAIVRFCRKKSGLSQSELARMAGVGKTVVFDIEKGKQSIRMDSLMKILEILNIRLSLKTPFPVEQDEHR